MINPPSSTIQNNQSNSLAVTPTSSQTEKCISSCGATSLCLSVTSWVLTLGYGIGATSLYHRASNESLSDAFDRSERAGGLMAATAAGFGLISVATVGGLAIHRCMRGRNGAPVEPTNDFVDVEMPEVNQ